MNLIKRRTSCKKMQGFTMVEALVSMLIFTIGFSGLYFFFTISQQAIVSSEKKMYLSLMADGIFQTIANKRKLTGTDNPFTSPNNYSGSLATCNYSATDVRQLWCTDLRDSLGPFNPASGKEVRQVDVLLDSPNLIVNITLITEAGGVKSFYTRKIRP
ncbi:MAG: prepilin-type N-terminal cleavage/methylation domain-containing protein [Methylophilaceae bacterium]